MKRNLKKVRKINISETLNQLKYFNFDQQKNV